jgi:hypothetical protein
MTSDFEEVVVSVEVALDCAGGSSAKLSSSLSPKKTAVLSLSLSCIHSRGSITSIHLRHRTLIHHFLLLKPSFLFEFLIFGDSIPHLNSFQEHMRFLQIIPSSNLLLFPIQDIGSLIRQTFIRIIRTSFNIQHFGIIWNCHGIRT